MQASSSPTSGRGAFEGLIKQAQPYLLLVPAGVFVLAVTVYPIISLFYTAFHSTHYFQVGAFNGFANFAPLFSASGVKSL